MFIVAPFGCAALIIATFATAFRTSEARGGSASTKHQATNDEVRKWGVIASGGRGYHDYHLQADVCHAYHILHHHGIPDENIVVMMYDDIAYNPQNPTPGIVVNYLDDRDYYAGTIKDYTGSNVTVGNFLNVLQGRHEFIKGGSGKVCGSGPNDHIFVYLNGPGARGLVSFPDGPLYAKVLTDAIKKMHDEKKYGKMVFYLYASYSGSMFEGLLPDDISVFATTSADPYEESCPSEWDDVRGVFVGDYYSVSWMRNSEAEFYRKRTLQEQFEDTRFETIFSTVTEYGDMGMRNMKVSEFQGSHVIPPPPKRFPNSLKNSATKCLTPMDILRENLRNTTDQGKKALMKKQLRTVVRRRDLLMHTVTQIIARASGCESEVCDRLLKADGRLSNHSCYQEAVKHFDSQCFELSRNTYVLKYLGAFVNMCENGVSIEDLRRAIEGTCIHRKMMGIV